MMLPTTFPLALAYQVQSKKWRILFLILAAINLIFNIIQQSWVMELYSAVTVVLLFTLNNYFLSWWKKRNDRNNPSSFRQFCKDMYLVTKHNKMEVFFWVASLGIAIAGMYLYTELTENPFLSWLVGIYLLIYISKHLFYSVLPPEWFLHDISTGYVFMSVLIGWGAAELMFPKLGDQFVLPMLISLTLCIGGIFLCKGTTCSRYLVPGSAVVLADIIWQIERFVQSSYVYTSQILATELMLIVAMVVGLLWLFKKPGILPIFYLSLFQLFRFSAFIYEAVIRVQLQGFSVDEGTYYILYLVCWMYIVPLIFWFSGLLHQKADGV